MGETAKGFVSGDGDLKMPAGIPWCDSGTTGMRFSAMKSYTPGEVIKYITPLIKGYPPYQKDIWDCEDHAFLAAADLRCNFPGLPVAIAVGTATDKKSSAGIKGQMHAVNYIWFESKAGADWVPMILDPADEKWIDEFDTKTIIPLPISGLKNHKELRPFELFDFRANAAFQLDERVHSFELITDGTVKKTLENKDFQQCTGPKDSKYKAFVNKDTWSTNDTVFYAFAQIRKKHMGAPVGVAFGELAPKNGPKEQYATLVLWSSQDQFIYWDVNLKRDISSDLKKIGAKFEPRLVIV
jgi:hypothetical protein